MYFQALYFGDYRHMTYIPPAFLCPVSLAAEKQKGNPFVLFQQTKKERKTLSLNVSLC